YGNEEGQEGEDQGGVGGLPGEKHVVCPDQEADDGNRQAGGRNEVIAEELLARESGNEFTDHAHGRENHDVHGGMGIEPEEVLEEDGIAAHGRIEEAEAEEALHAG